MNEISSLAEAHFDPHWHNKYATLMAAGNGYLGIRATHEEAYTTQTRGMFLAGLYHRASEEEPRELVNLPDVVGMHIEINGEILSLLSGKLLAYRRELRFATGELRREVIWESTSGQRYTLTSERFLSQHHQALFCQRIAITPHNCESRITVSTGIDATQTNAGRQHLDETEVRVFAQQAMQGVYRTRSGEAQVAITCACQVSPATQVSFSAKNRQLLQRSACMLQAGQTFTLEKYSLIERWLDDERPNAASQTSLAQLNACMARGYDALFSESETAWQAWWDKSRVPWLYDEPVLRANLDYYEPRTIHDSSLSKAIHGIVAARCQRAELAYRFWREGCQIDLGDEPHSCDDGIHAAASGAVWLGAVQGFAGVVALRDELHVNPALPEAWTRVTFPYCWQGRKLRFTFTPGQVAILSDGPVTLHLSGRVVEVNGQADFFIPFAGSGTSQEGK